MAFLPPTILLTRGDFRNAHTQIPVMRGVSVRQETSSSSLHAQIGHAAVPWRLYL
jgi:hypothetical protein